MPATAACTRGHGCGLQAPSIGAAGSETKQRRRARPSFFSLLALQPPLLCHYSQEVKTADAAPEPPSEAAAASSTPSPPPPPPPPVKKDPVPEGKAEIYIGFEKGDYAPRSGRTGRVIVDDPSRYPDRTVYVGGWPGGEVALKSWAPKAAAEASGKEGSSSSSSSSKARPAPSIPKAPKGAAPIYLGHAKDDYEGRREGTPGRFIVDDPSKYPDRENVGPLISAVGGFAGGEVGVDEQELGLGHGARDARPRRRRNAGRA